MIKRIEHFSTTVAGINRYIRKLARIEMAQGGYSSAYAQYLAVLYNYEEGLTAIQLSEMCDKDKAAISRAVASMTEKGLVYRARINNRSYGYRVCLTEEGIRMAELVCSRSQNIVDGVLEELSPEERELFHNTMARVADRLREAVRVEAACTGA